MLAMSLALLWGFSGILSFGQAAFFALGAYAMGLAAAMGRGRSIRPTSALLASLVRRAAAGRRSSAISCSASECATSISCS